MRKIAIIAACVTTFALSGCIEDRTRFAPDNYPIGFSGRIDPQTRASGSTWDADDEIGIYMLASGGTIDENSLADNVKHDHSGSGNFSASIETTALYYPATGSVDFIAYYPYTGAIDEGVYHVDVSDQTDLPDIDLMYSHNATAVSSGNPSLVFHHELVKLIFEVTDLDDASLEGISASIEGMKTRAAYDLSVGTLTPTAESEDEIAPALVSVEGSDAVLEAIVIPDVDMDLAIVFTLADGTRAALSLEDVTYEAGFAYTYTVNLRSAAEEVDLSGSDIDDWENGGGSNHDVDKTPVEVAPIPGSEAEYYLESFGQQDRSSWMDQPPLEDFTDWGSGCPDVTYTNTGSAPITIRSASTDPTNPYMQLQSGTSDIAIANLPEGYADITFSCDLSSASGSISNPVKVYAGETEVTPSAVATLYEASSYNFSVAVPDGTTAIRVVAYLDSGKSVQIDNIRLTGCLAGD